PLKFFDIDVFVYTPEELEQMLREGNKFLQRILREGILLYES
ncbi:MAG: nucleotidyltransferase domain-containing protein, partial [Nitrospirae bacterium]